MKELYLVTTVRHNSYYVIATDYTSAAQKVIQALNDADYDFEKYRVVSEVKLLAHEITEFPKGRPNFSVDGDIIFIDNK